MESVGDLLDPKRYEKKNEGKLKTIHSEEHELADELCKLFSEPKKFAQWLGVIKRNGIYKVRIEMANLREIGKLSPRLLMWKLGSKKKKTNGQPAIQEQQGSDV